MSVLQNDDSAILRHWCEAPHLDYRWTSLGFILISIVSSPHSVASLIATWLIRLPTCFFSVIGFPQG